MRQLRPSLLIVLGAAAVAACSDDTGVTNSSRPPLAGVRFINALPDTFDVDIRMVDQVDWSATANKLPFRSATQYWPTEAKARHIRVFPQPGVDAVNGVNPVVVSTVLLDTTITFEADRQYTLLLTGSARGNTERFVLIEDNPPATTGIQVAVKTVNAGVTGNVDAFLTPRDTTTLTGRTADLPGVGPLAASAYVVRDTGSFTAVRFAAGGTTTATASATAPNGTAGTSTINPQAGAKVPGTALSGYIFPASAPVTTGSRSTSVVNFASPGVIWFIDRLPPNTAVSTQ
jgi:hypothetical protein